MAKNALITGGSSGIGLAVAKDLISKGWNVSIVSRNPARAHLEDANLISCDLTDSDSCEWAVKEHQAAFGDHLDLLVNAAGIATIAPLQEQTAEGWDHEFAVNVRGMFLMIKHTRQMIVDARGLIVNIASISSFEGSRSMPAYSATKHAVLGLTKSVSKDLVGTGAKATAICPGYVATPMTAHVQDEVPADEMIQPLDIARAIEMLLALSLHAHVPYLEIRRS